MRGEKVRLVKREEREREHMAGNGSKTRESSAGSEGAFSEGLGCRVESSMKAFRGRYMRLVRVQGLGIRGLELVFRV